MHSTANCTIGTSSMAFNHSELLNKTETWQNCDGLVFNTTDGFRGLAENTAYRIFWGSYTVYPAAIIISRLLDYKLLLAQLISQLPRPRLALGKRWKRVLAQVFALLHVSADPIDAMASYLFTLNEGKETFLEVKKSIQPLTTPGGRERPGRFITEAEREKALESRARFVALIFLTYRAHGRETSIGDLVR